MSSTWIMYVVVLFHETNEVEVVPMSWVSSDTCRWPSKLKGLGLTKAIEMRLPPESDWDTYKPIRSLKESDSYANARKKCAKAVEMLSDLSTTEDEAKRKSRPPNKLLEDDSSEHETESEAEEVADHMKSSAKKRKKSSPLPSLPQLPSFPCSSPLSVSMCEERETPGTPTFWPETPLATPGTPTYRPETPQATPGTPAYRPETPQATPGTPTSQKTKRDRS